jgi:uncharacterized ion transporter superfamily protein YfcC
VATATAVSVGAPAQEPKKRTKKFNFPSAFTILFVITILAVAATWFVPAGSYSKLLYSAESNTLQVTNPEGEVSEVAATQEELDNLGVKIGIDEFTGGSITKAVSIPGTYENLPQNPMGLSDVTFSMVQGTIEGVDIIVFILVLGGLIGVVKASGAFESGLSALTRKTKGHEFILVFLVAILMVLGGTTCGLEEEAVAFYPILAPIFIAMGYDSIVTVGAIFMAGSIGTTYSTINPFSSVIASNAAGVVFTEGIEWRVFACIVGCIVIVLYLHWYCKKVKADPKFSYSYDDREDFKALWKIDDADTAQGVQKSFTWRKKVILLFFVSAFIIMVYGVMNLKWWFPAMAASFLAVAIICMFLAGCGKNGIGEKACVDAFSKGSSSLVAVALIIGLARGVNYVMNQGLISDTMLYASSNAVAGMSGPLFILMMMIIFFLLGFVVPSSSGLAVLSMPILAPLADTVGIPRWIIVCAYQWGQYAMLYIAPTGLIMATLQMLNMKYSHWLRFVWPMVLFTLVFGGTLLVIQTMMYSV